MRISDWSSDVCSSDLPGVLDARLGRRRHTVHFLDPDRPFLVHPKILSTRARPSISAATSSSLLYKPKLARAVAGTPRCSISGCAQWRSEEHTSELQSLMRIPYAVFCLKKKKSSKH